MEIKPQDLIFLVVLVPLIFKRNPNYFVIAGLLSLILSIPLFHQWIFFTAQRLVIYAFVFFTIAVIIHIIKLRKIYPAK